MLGLQHLDDVLRPIFKVWGLFDRNDVSAAGEQYRDELGRYLEKLEADVVRFEESRARAVERERARAERRSA